MAKQNEPYLTCDPFATTGPPKKPSQKPSQLNPPTESIPTHLLVATLQQPAAKKTPPRGNPTTQVGHHPHPSMELPPLGGETDDRTSLPSGPPSGPTNKLPAHSRPSEQEHQESSSVEITGQDYSTQWGTGKFTPSWGNYTVPPPEPWDPNPHPTITQETDQESEEDPTYLHRECSLCSTPLATFNAFEPLTCFACTNTLQTDTDTDHQITTALTHEEREDEEEFQFKGIPIAGENDGDSEESWERESWDTGDDRETEKDSFTNNLQWANWDTSEAHKQGEESPWFPQPRTVHILATEDITFSVGPRKDGIVKFTTTLPFVLTSNYYQLLADDTLI
jgi:hypothetical protein